jgi:serine/threonine protein kinase
MTAESLRPGGSIAGRYQLLEMLGFGGWGQVWKARDTGPMDRIVAVKLIHAGLVNRYTHRLFEREAAHGGQLTEHRNIVSIYDYGEDRSDPQHPVQYLVMELLDGGSLRTRLDTSSGQRLQVGETLRVLEQLAGGLAAAHRAGVIHRDVKPSNAMFGSDGIARIGDFGAAIAAADTRLVNEPVVGTQGYRAPEQEEGKEVFASDVYSLGVIGYECLTGRLPAAGSRSPMRHFPPQVRRLLRRALSRDLSVRHRDAQAFLDDVRAVKRELATGRRGPTAGIVGVAAVIVGRRHRRPRRKAGDRQQPRHVLVGSAAHAVLE